MIKKIVSIFLFFGIFMNLTFAATDLTQELDSNGGTLKVNNSLTINYEDLTFSEIVIFNARTVSQLEGGIDSSKFDDKGAEVLYISFKNNISLTTEPSKDISFGYNNLQNYINPVLLTYKNNKLVVINGKDNAGTYVFKISGSIDGAYKIVDSLVGDINNTSLISDTVDLLGKTIDEEELEFNSASEENVEIILSDLPKKGINDYYFLILSLALLIIFAIGYKSYRNS